MTASRRRLAAGALACALVLPPAGGGATITAPALVVTSVQATPGERGTLVRVEGRFPFHALVQGPYALQVFVRETHTGRAFLCFSLPRGVLGGESDALVDGLDPDTVWSAMAVAEPTGGARLLSLAPDALELWIAHDVGFRAAEASFFVIYEDEPVLSNAVPFALGPRP